MEQGIPSDIWHCRIDTSGRIVIPQSVRAAKRVASGDEISICKVGDEFVIRREDETLEQLLAAFRTDLPEGVNLVDELISERRAEAAYEEASH